MGFIILLGILVALMGIGSILLSWNRIKHPERFYQMMKKYNKPNSTPKTIIDIKKEGIICLFLGVACFCAGLFLAGLGFNLLVSSEYDTPPSKVESTPVDEDTMNDLGYYKENGKWNYEGGDAGQNDGRSGD